MMTIVEGNFRSLYDLFEWLPKKALTAACARTRCSCKRHVYGLPQEELIVLCKRILVCTLKFDTFRNMLYSRLVED